MSDLARQIVAAGHRGDPSPALAELTNPEPAVRIAALGALARCRALEDHHLTAAIRDPEAAARRRAVELAVAHPSIPLGPSLRDSDPLVADTAAWACGERVSLSDEDFAELITCATDHPDPVCRESAVAALGAIGDPRALDTILTATNDKPAVRRRAALALAPFDGEAVEQTLRRLLEDRDWQVRQAAEDLLG